MRKSNIYPLIILLDAFENAALTVILGLNYLWLHVRIVCNCLIYSSTGKLGYKAFTAVNTAPGFMPDPSSLTCSKRQNSQNGSHNQAQQSAHNSTKLLAPFSPQSTVNATSIKTFPAANAKPKVIDGNNIVPGVIPPPSNLGRWCERCQDYKIFARLERVGASANAADYIPHCITCGTVLSPIKPDSGF